MKAVICLLIFKCSTSDNVQTAKAAKKSLKRKWERALHHGKNNNKEAGSQWILHKVIITKYKQMEYTKMRSLEDNSRHGTFMYLDHLQVDRVA